MSGWCAPLSVDEGLNRLKHSAQKTVSGERRRHAYASLTVRLKTLQCAHCPLLTAWDGSENKELHYREWIGAEWLSNEAIPKLV